jgi:hypothetical protein
MGYNPWKPSEVGRGERRKWCPQASSSGFSPWPQPTNPRRKQLGLSHASSKVAYQLSTTGKTPSVAETAQHRGGNKKDPMELTCIRLVWTTHGRSWPGRLPFRLSALTILYFHSLYILVIKILSYILNSSAPIHSLYHPLSTMGSTYHFI